MQKRPRTKGADNVFRAHNRTKLMPHNIGLVTLVFWSLNTLMRSIIQMPRDFFQLAASAIIVDYKNH